MVSDQSIFQVWSPRLLSVLRIVTALLFMMHGTAKLFQMPHQAMFDNLQLISLMGLQGVLEAGGGLLLLIGLFSRPIAFVLSGDMAVAYFMAHWPKSWLRSSTAAILPFCSALYSSICGLRVQVPGASMRDLVATRSRVDGDPDGGKRRS
jgi:uncharacterized membrane protein YphA (DoxX/SURF4 family)